MREHKQIIVEAGGAAVLAEKLGLSLHTVRSWVQRQRIPGEHWAAIVGIGAASPDELLNMARPRKRPDLQLTQDRAA